MFDPNLPLSSDLDWMLQSGQANSSMLVEALTAEYYEPLHALASGILNDSVWAEEVTQDIFAAALVNVYRYRSQVGVRVWLYRIAVEVLRSRLTKTRLQALRERLQPVSKRIPDPEQELPSDPGAACQQAITALPEKPRLATWLHYVLDCSVPEIGRVLNLRDTEVEEALETARQSYRSAIQVTLEDYPTSKVDQDEQIASALKTQFTIAELPEGFADQMVERIETKARQKGSFRGKITSVREIVIVILAAVAVGGLIWGVNTYLPDAASSDLLAEEATATSLPSPKNSIYYFVRSGDTVESIANEVGTTVDSLRQMNNLSDASLVQPGARLRVAVSDRSQSAPTPTPVEPVELPRPLSKRSEPQDVLQRMALSGGLWRTLWLDVQVLSYGPASYLGPPMLYRSQVWVSQPDQSLELFGSLTDEPLSLFTVSGGHSYFSNLDQGQVLLDPPWAQVGQPVGRDELHQMIFPDRSDLVELATSIEIVGDEKVAGRQTLVVDWLDGSGLRPYRLWVDTQTGLILRQRLYASPDYEKVETEVVVTDLNLNQEFRPDLFDPQLPWESGWALDESAERAATEERLDVVPELALDVDEPAMLPYDAPPPGFSPSTSGLTFQLPPERLNIDSDGSDALVEFDLFADGYFLGQVDFGLPWSMVCSRSPDGEKLAFTSGGEDTAATGGPLRWFHLRDLSQVYQPLGGFMVSQLAFAPDSRHLAVFGYDLGGDVRAGIYLVDIGTGEAQLMTQLAGAHSLVWSPDGSHLALVGQKEAGGQEEVVILLTGARQVVYRTPLASGDPPEKWPTASWGVEFPLNHDSGLNQCALPPRS